MQQNLAGILEHDRDQGTQASSQALRANGQVDLNAPFTMLLELLGYSLLMARGFPKPA